MWKKSVSLATVDLEVELQQTSNKLGFSPRILTVDKSSDPAVISMEVVKGMTLSDMYGDEAEDLPEWIWDSIRDIVVALFDEDIEYIDITPYNFMQVGKEIVAIDFGDATYRGDEVNWFLQEFMDGENGWNPDFK